MAQHVAISICENADDAINKGHVYGEEVTSLDTANAVIVKDGTAEGNATVDLVFKDHKGNRYICMSTLNLLRSIVIAADAAKG